MLLTPGQTLASYEILTLLGKGGMGEVYKARDPKLDRDVAIKVLPEEFAKDEERLLRFQREAKLLASLEHPHVAAIHGCDTVQQEGGEPIHFLILEYVEGESLAQRLENGPLNVDDALEVCEQITQGLEAAHDKGIVHRDLKPQNVMLRSDGSIKVLDFGLARAMTESSSTSASSDSPTITADYTEPGVVLGTAPYMSPEQARGRSLDLRTDIWSFGCVLYECLTGKVLFSGESSTESMGAILHKEPEWSLLPAGTPPTIQLLLRRCLAKDRKRRLRSIADAGLELQEVIADPTGSSIGLATAALRTGSGARHWAKSIGALALVAAITAAGMGLLRPTPPEAFVQRHSIRLPDGLHMVSSVFGNLFDVSRDGRVMVIAARSEAGEGQLYVREADQLELRPLGGTDAAVGPRVSPDGQWVVYYQQGSFKKMSIRGGPPITLRVGGGSTAGWSDDGWIYYFRAPSGLQRLLRVSENGGEVQALGPEAIMTLPNNPNVFPGGAVLFTEDTETIMGLRPGGSEFERIVEGFSPQWSPTGHLLFVRQSTLMAAPFDPVSLEVGPAVPLIEGIATDLYGSAHYVMTPSGTLYYLAGTALSGGLSQLALVRVAMDGSVDPLAVQTGAYRGGGMSRDGRRMALVTAGSTGSTFDKTLWVLDVQRDILTPLPAGSAVGGETQLWSPDGEWIYYAAAVENDSSTEARGGLGLLGIRSALYRIRANGSSGGELISGGEGLLPTSISGDGTRLYAERQGDIVVINLDEEFRVEDVITGPASETGGAISSDGNWLAYRSDSSGEDQIYISTADGKGGRVQVSRDGGSALAWSPDGKNLYFNTGRTRMVVEVKTATEDEGSAVPAAQGVSASAEDLEISRPTALFDLDPLHAPGFLVTADGESFLHISLGQSIVGSGKIDEIIVTLNFDKELERLVSDQNK